MEGWIPFFVMVTALAILVQAVVLIALFVQLRRTAARVEQTVSDFNTKVTPLVARVQVLVDDISPRISGIVSDASEITRMARSEAQKVDRVLSEALERLRQTVWAPVVKATALIRGVQAGIDFFRTARHRGGRVEVPTEQQDEGMFI
jgi:predicted PurR-regulated permease PerM